MSAVTPEKPRVASPVKPKTQSTPIARAMRETAKDALDAAVFEKRPYLKMAFQNPYNVTLLGAGIVVSILTLNPLPALIALGGEALWLLHGPDSKCAGFSGTRASRKSAWRSRRRSARSA
jgi:hypothetical protein